MNSFSLAFKLFRTNVRTYSYYLAVMVFAVTMYYDFMALKHNPEVLKTRDMIMQARAAAQLTSVVFLVFLVFFIAYSSSFFLKQRKKEIGVYSLMGISHSKIGLVFAIESLFFGAATVGVGLLLGILLSKLFIMALAKAALLNVTIEFAIPMRAVWETVITFGIIFLFLSVRNYINVIRSRLIDLVSDAKKNEGLPKWKVLRGIFSLLLIGTGYYLSLDVFNTPDFMGTSLLIVILVVLGTYWFFGAVLSMVMRILVGRKRILYSGPRIVSISNIAFRVKGNYRSLAILAVMSACTITTFGTSLSLQYYIDKTHSIQFPYSFSYVTSGVSQDDLHKKVTDTIKNSKHELLLKEEVPFLRVPGMEFEEIRTLPSDILVVKYSEFVRVTRELKVKDAEELIERAKPFGNHVSYIQSPGVIASAFDYKGKKFSVDGKEYVIQQDFKTPLLGAGATGTDDCIIVPDETYARMGEVYPEWRVNGFLVSNPEESAKLAMELMDVVPKEYQFFAYVGQYQYQYRYQFIGLFYFLGIFMSIVFILATGSIMYFKLLSEGLADKAKYEMLSKIGMSRKEIGEAVSRQVGISLVLPLGVAIVHSLFAINVLKDFLNYDLTVPTLAAIGIFALIYSAFYLVTTKRFLGLVCLPEER